MLFLICAFLFSGCEKELSQEEVEGSEYYQKLQTENQEQKKEIEELENQVKELNQSLTEEQNEKDSETSESTGNKKAEKYFKKVQNATLVRLEIAYTDDYCDSVYVNDKAVFPLAQALAGEADLTTKYTPKELRNQMGAGYLYTLYEEDSSIFQLEVYGDGYVIFSDLPGQVYYCPDSNLLGQAYLVRKGSYPNSKLLHRMADSAIVVQYGKNAWTNETCVEVANWIHQLGKGKKIDEQHPKKDPVATYSFYSYGNRMELALYKKQLCITAWDGKTTWYEITNDEYKEIRQIF
jgi:hypothetical protein